MPKERASIIVAVGMTKYDFCILRIEHDFCNVIQDQWVKYGSYKQHFCIERQNLEPGIYRVTCDIYSYADGINEDSFCAKNSRFRCVSWPDCKTLFSPYEDVGPMETEI